jgi:hypothetical protein
MKQKAIGKVSFIGGQATDYVAQFTLTAADITTLKSVPLQLIKAPGVGRAIMVRLGTFQFKFGTVQFTGGGLVSLVYHGATGNLLSGAVPAAVVNAGVDAVVSFGSAGAATILTPNTGVDLTAATGDFAAGDGKAVVTVWWTDCKVIQP